MYDIFSLKDYKMPDGFLWGSGYAGHQVEGNNVNSNRWYNEQNGKTLECSGLACNSYEMYEDDIALVDKLGHRAFRTSVEWSRIEPEEGMFCEEALDHYVKLFSGLRQRGIKVFATMVHMCMPLWFAKLGAFRQRENLKYFERYLEHVVPRIAPYVDFWNVLNEENMGGTESKLGSLHFHALGYHIIKKYSSAPVSSAHALVQYVPQRYHDRWDRAMAETKDLENNEYFFHAIRTGEIVYPSRDGEWAPEVKGTADYWSVNSYVRSMIDARRAKLGGKRYDCKELKMIDMDFYLEEIDPECIIANTTRLMDKPVYISENGCCCNDDRFRIVFISLYLSAVAEAIKMGVDIRGYLYWSLLDNYEWSSFKPRFGLCDCNRSTFERTPKPSAYFYREIIDNNGFDQSILRKYLSEMPSLLGH